jgi:hypothetical protein
VTFSSLQEVVKWCLEANNGFQTYRGIPTKEKLSKHLQDIVTDIVTNLPQEGVVSAAAVIEEILHKYLGRKFSFVSLEISQDLHFLGCLRWAEEKDFWHWPLRPGSAKGLHFHNRCRHQRGKPKVSLQTLSKKMDIPIAQLSTRLCEYSKAVRYFPDKLPKTKLYRGNAP